MTKPSSAVVLLNLGTPDSPQRKDVRKYLREFLMDPYVMGMPYPVRYLLVNGVIAPFRAGHSSQAYSSIWTGEGSPLLVNTRRLTDKIALLLPHHKVCCAMRYGSPSLSSVLSELNEQGISQIKFVPLYPQATGSTYSTAVEHLTFLMRSYPEISYSVFPPFYDKDWYIEALSSSIGNFLLHCKQFADYLLFSFHGIPLKHILLDNNDPLITVSDNYPAQCRLTASAVVARLRLLPELKDHIWLKDGNWGVSFQSRLGPVKWLKPSTASQIKALPSLGHRNIAVVAPSFVADCLETSKELADVRWLFWDSGGESFSLINCLNDNDYWAELLAEAINSSL